MTAGASFCQESKPTIYTRLDTPLTHLINGPVLLREMTMGLMYVIGAVMRSLLGQLNAL